MPEVSLTLDLFILCIVGTIVLSLIVCATVRAIRRERKKNRDEYTALKEMVYRADEILTGQSHYGRQRKHAEHGLEYRVSQIEQGLGVESPKKRDEGWVW